MLEKHTIYPLVKAIVRMMTAGTSSIANMSPKKPLSLVGSLFLHIAHNSTAKLASVLPAV